MALVDDETGEKIIASLPIDAIKIGYRHRTIFGDLDALAASIKEVGLLHPIVVTANHELIAGHRRIEACRNLGVQVVPVRVIKKVTDATLLLKAERDENTCRKDFTPSEAVALGRALEALERPKAKERMSAGGKGAKVSQPSRTSDLVGEAVGMSGRTYEKARSVVATSEDEAAPGPVRLAAVAAVEEMDRTGKVDPAHRKVNEAKAMTEQAVAMASEDPAVARQLLKTKVLKASVSVSSALKDLDPHDAAGAVDDRDRDRLSDWAERHIDWLTSFRSSLRPLRVVKEN